MAVISQDNMTLFQSLLGESYQNLLSGYGDVDTEDSAAFSIAKSKSFVRGGAEAVNGIRSTALSGSTVLDLRPTETAGATTLSVRRGRFYIGGALKELVSDATVECDVESASCLDTGGTFAWDATKDMVAKGLLYASLEAVKESTTSAYEVTDATTADADFIIIETDAGGTGNERLAQICGSVEDGDVIVDEVQLYLSTTGSPACNLYVQLVQNDVAGTPDEPGDVSTSDLLGTSVEVTLSDVDSDGGWVSFPLLARVTLTQDGTDYDNWVVLRTTADDDTAWTLGASDYIQWHGEVVGGVTVDTSGSATSQRLEYAAASWGDLSGNTTDDAAHKLIGYIHAMWTTTVSATTGDIGVVKSQVANLSAPTPTVPYAPIVEVMMEASSGSTDGFGTTAGNESTATDQREIVGYTGLEDDDQMADLFAAINTTENAILDVVNETTTTDAITAYSSICTGLATHITRLVSGSTFKTYWGANARQVQFNRYFRRIWYLNQTSEELNALYGTRINTGATVKWAAAGSNWVSQNTYCVNMTTGTSLELITPVGGTAIDATAEIAILAIKPAWAALDIDHSISAATITLENIPTSWGSTTNSHIWIEYFGQTDGELLNFSALSGNQLTLAISTYAGATAAAAHEAGSRVYLVDVLTYTIPDAGFTENTQVNASGTLYIGAAYIDIVGGTAARQLAVRSV